VVVPALDAGFFRDARRRPPRAVALLVVEIQQLESLLQATSAAAPDRPVLLRRLAEDYVELEKAGANASVVDRARKAAIRYYTALVDEYAGHPSPTFPSAVPAEYAQLDEATYYLAYEHERAGDDASARRAYLQLIQRWPASRFVPRAYLAFGDLFFGEAMSDASKWELAGAAYAKVLASPPPANEVYGYAWYRLAYVVANQGDRARALQGFRKAAEWSTAFPQAPGAAMLGAEANAQMKSFAGPSSP
jgi:tetratricopeptide (TPR) repeat protein